MPADLRRLLLLRHAKSAWPEGVADHDRPLGERGRRDAAAVGRWLAAAGARPDMVLVSSAQRARETWDGVAGELGPAGDIRVTDEVSGAGAGELGPAGDVRVTDEVYGAGAGDLLDVLREVPERSATVLVVGHNPGIERLAALLDDGEAASGDGTRMRVKFPTSGLAVLDVPHPWSALDPETCRLAAFVVPRG